MRIFSPKEVQTAFAKLPEDLREATASVDVAEVLSALGRRHGLAMDKIGELVAETGFVMFGLTNPDEFIARLGERLKVSEAGARIIAQDVSAAVFSRVRASMQKIHGIHGEDSLLGPPAPAGGVKDEVMTHLEADEAAPPPPLSSPSVREEDLGFSVRGLMLAAAGVGEPLSVKGLMQAAFVPDNLPVESTEAPPSFSWSMPLPKPPKKMAAVKTEAVVRMLKEEKAVSYASGGDPYRESIV